MLSQLNNLVGRWFRRHSAAEHSDVAARRGPRTHVIILDGTMSSLTRGEETNAGQAYRLLREMGSDVSLYYEAGIQWKNWHSAIDVMIGRGINRQIRRAYGFLASRYKPGDRIYLMGYSRGAFAVRSLAGVIDRIGLLRAEHANTRNIELAYRHYQIDPVTEAARTFSQLYCHQNTMIEVIGVWDTVKALGFRVPLLWRWQTEKHAFHNHQISNCVRHGFHALAYDETRSAFEPVLWQTPENFVGHVEQVWFRGTHGDIGGHVGSYAPARPLANIPFVWVMERAEDCGLPLPENWKRRFPQDPKAPSVGTWMSWGKLFVIRARRRVLKDRTERLHPTCNARKARSILARTLRAVQVTGLRRIQKL